MTNQNTTEYLHKIRQRLFENLRMLPHAPGVQMAGNSFLMHWMGRSKLIKVEGASQVRNLGGQKPGSSIMKFGLLELGYLSISAPLCQFDPVVKRNAMFLLEKQRSLLHCVFYDA